MCIMLVHCHSKDRGTDRTVYRVTNANIDLSMILVLSQIRIQSKHKEESPGVNQFQLLVRTGIPAIGSTIGSTAKRYRIGPFDTSAKAVAIKRRIERVPL